MIILWIYTQLVIVTLENTFCLFVLDKKPPEEKYHFLFVL